MKIHRHASSLLLGLLLVGGVLASSQDAVSPASREMADHQCHLFGYLFGEGAGDEQILSILCQYLYDKTVPDPGEFRCMSSPASDASWRETPSRDGWGFGYFLAPPHPGIERPILIKSGAAASEDDLRWNSAQDEIGGFALQGATTVLGHVRLSSYGPDGGALPDPHPFADSLFGRWWLFAHNGHMVPDTLLPWIPETFLEQHPLDYDPIHVDSEVFFRYCLYEIESLGSVKEGLLCACHRVKEYDDFVFNICFTDGDTLWTAHSHGGRPFYFDAVEDSSAWWTSTVWEEGDPPFMYQHHLYWFTAGSMGAASYE